MWVRASAAIDTHDSAGTSYSADDMRSLIDKAVSSFDFAYHKPPVLLHHDESGDVQAWVKGLKKEILPVRTAHGTFVNTDVLLADVQDIDPEFGKKLESKKHLPVSAAFYPDGRFRHLAYVPIPAVKGNFADNEYFTIKFEEGIMPDGMEAPGEKTAGEQMPKWASDLMKRVSDIEATLNALIPKEKAEDTGKQPEGNQFSESDVAALRDAAFAEGRKQAEISAWCDSAAKKLRPALFKGVREFMESPTGKLCFGEASDVKGFVKGLIDRFVAIDIDGKMFSEFAKGGAEQNKASGIGKEIAAEINRQKGVKV